MTHYNLPTIDTTQKAIDLLEVTIRHIQAHGFLVSNSEISVIDPKCPDHGSVSNAIEKAHQQPPSPSGQFCSSCGGATVFNGPCLLCIECGETTGCS